MKKTTIEKIRDNFSSINIALTDKPTANLFHLYADYVELVSLFSNRNYVSSTDILDRLRDDGMLLRDRKRDEEQAEDNDVKENLIDSIFRELQNRTHLYKNDYPFELIEGNKIILKEGVENDTRQKVYIFLLLASNLSIFDLFTNELTTEFETISFEALKNFLPPKSIVKEMGQNTQYSGNTINKIKELANEINIKVDEEAIKQISEKANKEKGLDLIGWIPFDDGLPNLIMILCQCACGKEWYKKVSETNRYEHYFRFHCKRPIHSMFIPYSQINYQETIFYQFTELPDTLLFDRKRILNHIKDSSFFDSLNSKLVVDKCIEFEEDIV
jgi:hypothetical protein